MMIGRLKELYELDPGERILSDWHALTYEVRRAGQPFILRVTSSSHRSTGEVAAELDWMEYVGTRGVRVPAVFRSKRDCLVESLKYGDTSFSAVLFEKLDGRTVTDEDLQPSLFVQWGKLVGRLHKLATEFKPKGESQRKAWFESDFLNIEKYVPDDNPEVKKNAQEATRIVKDLPKSSCNFGLMHADVYQDNFFIGERSLQLFDFDNAEIGYFVNDIAVAIYAYLWRVPEEALWDGQASEFLKHFRAGYECEYDLPADQWQHIPLFLKLRDVLIYTVTWKKRKLSELNDRQRQNFLAREARIVKGQPIVTRQASVSFPTLRIL